MPKNLAAKAAPGQYVITLSSVGNPDFGQYAPLSPKRTVIADSLAAIAEECERYQREWELGGGNWTSPTVYRDGVAIGYFSWNLRLWKGSKKDWKNKEEILYRLEAKA